MKSKINKNQGLGLRETIWIAGAACNNAQRHFCWQAFCLDNRSMQQDDEEALGQHHACTCMHTINALDHAKLTDFRWHYRTKPFICSCLLRLWAPWRLFSAKSKLWMRNWQETEQLKMEDITIYNPNFIVYHIHLQRERERDSNGIQIDSPSGDSFCMFLHVLAYWILWPQSFCVSCECDCFETWFYAVLWCFTMCFVKPKGQDDQISWEGSNWCDAGGLCRDSETATRLADVPDGQLYINMCAVYYIYITVYIYKHLV